MEMLLFQILLTWRITSLLVNEPGPFEIFGKFRDLIGVGHDEFARCIGSNEFAKVFCCYWCASIWIGIIIALFFHEPWYAGLAYSAGAVYFMRTVGQYG